jgi:hypothetical protein
MSDDREVTHDEALDAEAALLRDYGLTGPKARTLIDDMRRAGGVDAFLRQRTEEAS